MSDRSVVVRLSDGPCEGRFASIAVFRDECYQKLSNREQVWLRYLKNLYKPGEFIWSGEAITTHELAQLIKNDKNNTYGQSEGA